MTLAPECVNGKRYVVFPFGGQQAQRDTTHMSISAKGSYLKKHTEALVKDVGVEPACEITGKSKATLGRYYSDNPEHADRFMPVDAVARLEEESSYPHVTAALAELKGITLSYDDRKPNADRTGGVNADVIALSQRFAMLMSEYQPSIEDGVISTCQR